MTPATPAGRLERSLERLHDNERSRAFHEGRVALGLERIEALLGALGPLPAPRVAVHVAGSEGKTSTTELLAAGLSAQGLTVAGFTSPHLRDVRERLRIGGRFPPEPLLDSAVAAVEAAAARLGHTPSWFEFLTATARVLFAEACVDGVVWETGLGGRLDATRLMPADLCVITTVSLEHSAVLGPTVAAIAAEKAGILRPGRPLVLGGGVPEEARAAIEPMAAALGCAVHQAAAAPDTRAANLALARLSLDVLAGEGLVAPRDASVDAVLESTRIAGRWQRVGQLLFDGAHSVAAAQRLAAELAPLSPASIVCGITSGRDAAAMLSALAAALPPGGLLVTTRAPGERGVPAAELAALAPGHVRVQACEEPPAALATARSHAGREGLVVVTGSLYLIGLLLPESSA